MIALIPNQAYAPEQFRQIMKSGKLQKGDILRITFASNPIEKVDLCFSTWVKEVIKKKIVLIGFTGVAVSRKTEIGKHTVRPASPNCYYFPQFAKPRSVHDQITEISYIGPNILADRFPQNIPIEIIQLIWKLLYS